MKEKFNLHGKLIDATLMPVTQTVEHFNEYLLDDGSVVRVKCVLKKMLKLDGIFDAERNPVYVAQTQNILTASCPEAVKHKPCDCQGEHNHE